MQPQLVLPQNLYDSKRSKSFRPLGKDFRIRYGSGVLQGYLSNDTVVLGPKLSVTGQIFTEAVSDPDGIFAETEFDGILGLGKISIN